MCNFLHVLQTVRPVMCVKIVQVSRQTALVSVLKDGRVKHVQVNNLVLNFS